MPLDPQARAVLDQIPLLTDELLLALAPPVLRQAMAAMPGSAGGDVEPVVRVENRTLPGPAGEIPVRIYAPAEQRGLPALVYFHGGGFVIGDLETHDGTCRSLANGIGCIVVSVDYRLAPEHKFPAGPEDCYAATRWVAEKGAEIGVDTSRVCVGGDSAGGNLTAVVALMARDRGGPALRHQLLIYPVANHDFDTKSYEENKQGYLLSREMMRWFWNHYLARPEDGKNPYASPLRAASFAGLPPAHVITAEYDPLRDEGEALAARLQQGGVPTTHIRYDGMFHGFFAMTQALDTAKRAVAEAAAAVRASL